MTKNNTTAMSEDLTYDGFYFSFIDHEEGEEKKDPLNFFKIASDKNLSNVPEDKHPIGDKFLMAFLKFDDNAVPVFEETVEAILADPVVYVQNLVGSGRFGCIVRKTPRGEAWFDKHYVQNAHKVIAMAKKRFETEN
jgi:hypothetical protein